jgi:site-specific recombinase XerD
MTWTISPEDLSFQSQDSSILASRSEPFKEVFEGLADVDLGGKEHLELYLRHLVRRNCRRLTIVQATGTLRLFLGFVSKIGCRLEELRRRDLETFIEREQDRGLRLSSVRTKLARVYAFLSFLVEEGIIPGDVVARKIQLKIPQYLPRAMDPDDVRGLVSVVKESRDRAMILVLLRTGMRISELLALKVDDIKITDQRVVIHEGAKTHRGRVVYVSDDARDALKMWLTKRDPLREFLFYGRTSRLSYTSARHMFEKYLRRAELVHKGYTLHCLRHTFASELLNAGMRIEYLQELMGHDSIQVTRRYAKLTNKTLEAEYFRAMARIQKGKIHGTYRPDHKLQTVLEAKKRLTLYRQKLSRKPEALSPVAPRTR